MEESRLAALAHLATRHRQSQAVRLAGLVSVVLHEPVRRAEQIILDNLIERKRSLDTWHRLAALSQERAIAMASSLSAPDFPAIADFIDRNNRGTLVTTFHGGDYLLGLLNLRSLLKSDKTITIVRKKEQSEIERGVFSHFNREGNEIEVVRHGRHQTIRLIRRLRAGQVVVALHDLPASYGPTIDTPFLGVNMHMVKGPASLAVMGRADVVALGHYRCRERSHACAIEPIRSTSIAMIRRRLAHSAESIVREFPEQWLHWFHLPELIDPTARP